MSEKEKTIDSNKIYFERAYKLFPYGARWYIVNSQNITTKYIHIKLLHLFHMNIINKYIYLHLFFAHILSCIMQIFAYIFYARFIYII
jgi:hypothetical protein